MKTRQEIEQQLALAGGLGDESKWPGMSYEQGVHAALNWVLGFESTAPMDGE